MPSEQLPAVGGRRLDCSLAFFEQRCLIQLREEQESINPNNTLIAVLCDAVRLAREYGDTMQAPIILPSQENSNAK